MKEESVLTGDFIPSEDPKIGRPSHYHPKYCQIVKEVGSSGGFDIDMALACDLKSRTSLYNWARKYPEFEEALEEASMLSDAWWIDLTRRMSKGDVPKGNVTALALILNNKIKGFSRTGNGSGVTEVTNVTINNFDKLSQKELMDQIKAKIARIPEMKEIPPDVG